MAEDLKTFIREHRSAEGNFEKVLARLKADKLLVMHPEVQQRADEYLVAKETRQEAWPEFEKFITEIEKNLT